MAMSSSDCVHSRRYSNLQCDKLDMAALPSITVFLLIFLTAHGQVGVCGGSVSMHVLLPRPFCRRSGGSIRSELRERHPRLSQCGSKHGAARRNQLQRLARTGYSRRSKAVQYQPQRAGMWLGGYATQIDLFRATCCRRKWFCASKPASHAYLPQPERRFCIAQRTAFSAYTTTFRMMCRTFFLAQEQDASR